MAAKGTKNTAITFGNFEISVKLVKAERDRDVKSVTVQVVAEKPADPTPADAAPVVEASPVAEEKPVVLETYRAFADGEDRLRIPDGELEAIEKASQERFAAMQVLEVIDYRQVPTERISGAYWLQPTNGSVKGLALLCAALKGAGKVAVVKWVARSREKLGVIRVRHIHGKGSALLLSELVHANDFADPDEDILAINAVMDELDPRALEVASDLLDAFGRDGEKAIDTASDTAVDARIALRDRLHEERLQRQLEQAADDAADEADADEAEVVDLEGLRAA